MELCVAGLFILVRKEDRTYACIGQAAIMIILTAFTIAFQIVLNKEFCHLNSESQILKIKQIQIYQSILKIKQIQIYQSILKKKLASVIAEITAS